MKKLFFSIILVLAIISCKNESKEAQKGETLAADSPEKTAKQSDGLTLLKGEFVFYEGAAVLQTHADIYGVFINDKLHELNQLTEKYKTVPTDMVPVEIRGKITNEKDDVILWENKVEIVEILNVFEPEKTDNDIVELGS